MSSPCRPGSSTSGARRRRRTSPPTKPSSPWRVWCISACSVRRDCARRGRPAWRSRSTRRSAWRTADSSLCFRKRQRSRSLPSGSDGARPRRSGLRAHTASIRATRWGATTPGWTTHCSSLSPSGAPPTRSTASRRRWRRERPTDGWSMSEAKLIYERSQRGRRGVGVPKPELPVPEIPDELARKEPPRLPEVAEPEVLRHFTELSTRNFGIDTGFYPLGSCTMKYNPRVNERLAALPGFRDLHPLVGEEAAQGALELEWRLQEILLEITGLDAVSLQPAAGSQGELTGLLLFRAYFAERGEDERRRRIVIPDTAHGTNPASVTMAGYELTPVKTDARGNIDIDDL